MNGCAYYEPTADEMFQELGYKVLYNPIQKIFHLEYSKDELDNDTLKTVIIQFWNDKTFDKVNEFDGMEYITMKELQAINKKVSELGWN